MNTESNLITCLADINLSVITNSISNKDKTNLGINSKFSSYLAHWEINSDLIFYFAGNIPNQNMDADSTVFRTCCKTCLTIW